MGSRGRSLGREGVTGGGVPGDEAHFNPSQLSREEEQDGPDQRLPPGEAQTEARGPWRRQAGGGPLLTLGTAWGR